MIVLVTWPTAAKRDTRFRLILQTPNLSSVSCTGSNPDLATVRPTMLNGSPSCGATRARPLDLLDATAADRNLGPNVLSALLIPIGRGDCQFRPQPPQSVEHHPKLFILFLGDTLQPFVHWHTLVPSAEHDIEFPGQFGWTVTRCWAKCYE